MQESMVIDEEANFYKRMIELVQEESRCNLPVEETQLNGKSLPDNPALDLLLLQYQIYLNEEI